MIIESKFDIQDIVYLIEGNGVKKAVVKEIKVNINSDENASVNYLIDVTSDERFPSFRYDVSETVLHGSREDLVDALLKEDE